MWICNIVKIFIGRYSFFIQKGIVTFPAAIYPFLRNVIHLLHMENQTDNLQQVVPQINILFQVTPFSRLFTGTLLVVLPFLGFWVGMQYSDSAVEAVPVNIVQAPEIKNDTSDTLSDVNVDEESAVRQISEMVLKTFKTKDVETFKTLVHPVEGVRFSRDGYISTDNVKMTVSEIEAHILKNDVIAWGLADGSGLPINKTFDEWFQDYSKIDYLNAPESAFNKALGPNPYVANNIKENYPNKPLMSFYIPFISTEKDENGKEVPATYSWKAIDLVFDTYNNQLYLVGIITDNWTI